MKTRRAFVVLSSGATAKLLLGCGADDEGGSDPGSDTASPMTDGMDGASTGAGGTDDGGGTGGGGGTDDGGGTGGGATTSGGGSTGSAGGTGGTTGGGDLCEATTPDIEGPFYRPGIPVGGELDVHGDEGIALQLQGRVLGGDCEPIAGAIVELWHASPVAPEGQPGDEDATYDVDTYAYYGQVATDADGAYAFRTLKPGWYLNGAEYRPAHLHIKIWIATEERLTTQLYFAGDPFNADDPWYDATRELDPDAGGRATIDFVV